MAECEFQAGDRIVCFSLLALLDMPPCFYGLGGWSQDDSVMRVRLPWWYTLALRGQLLFGVVYGVLMLTMPLQLLHLTAAAPLLGLYGNASTASTADAATTGVALDFARWLGAAHLCLGAMAWLGLRYRHAEHDRPDPAAHRANDASQAAGAAVVAALAVPAAIYFALSACLVNPLSEARGDTWAAWALPPAHVVELAFLAAHVTWLLRNGRDAVHLH